MKTNSDHPVVEKASPGVEEIRDYAYHLYCQNGCRPGHEIEDWLEAEACLMANIPKHEALTRLHRHLRGQKAA